MHLFRTCPSEKRPRGRPTPWRELYLAYKCLKIPQEKLEEVLEEKNGVQAALECSHHVYFIMRVSLIIHIFIQDYKIQSGTKSQRFRDTESVLN